jgi:opacity protein-like surface antigen
MRSYLLVILAAAAFVAPAHAQSSDVPVPGQVHPSTAPVAANGRSTGMLTGVDLMTSTVLQEGQSSFSGLAGRVILQPQSLVQDLEILPTIEYWRNSSSISQPYDIRTTRKDATLAVDARYRFHPKGWEPYLGAGFGMHFLSASVNAPTLGLNDASDSVIKGALAALAGANFELSPRIDSFVELKYHHVTDYKQLKINWGLTWKM